MDDDFKDVRFTHVRKDPKFRCLRKSERKVKIDQRFKGMFSDGKFKLKYHVDKRGRPLHVSTSENLKKYYDISSSESESEGSDNDDVEDEEEGNDNIKKEKVVAKKKELHSETESSSCSTSDEEEDKLTVLDVKDTEKEKTDSSQESEKKRMVKKGIKKTRKEIKNSDENEMAERKKSSSEGDDSDTSDESDSEDGDSDVDYSRGVHVLQSSSSEDESDSDDDDEVEENIEKFDHKWGEMDKEAEETDEITARLALCNMNWDRLKAHDIMAIMTSFKTSGGSIKSVHIYQSQFGLERMKAEELKGPAELVSHKEEDNTDKATEGRAYQREKLRQYQLNRLKYYYAVVECDKPETANAIYELCDGMEYESTGNKLDLRFIPNGMKFDQEPSSLAVDVPDTATYKPSSYVTSALQQSSVQCTWDETDHDRVAVTMRKFNKDDLEEMDLKHYLASDSEEEGNPYGNIDVDIGGSGSEDEETQIQKYRNLIKGLGGEKEVVEDNDMEMEITWEPGLRETAEVLVKKQLKEKTSTPWEQFLDKKKDKKKLKRQEKRKSEKEGTEDIDDKVAVSDDDIPNNIDLNDPYFKDEMQNMDKGGAVKSTTEKKTKKQKYKKKKLTPEELKEKEERGAELKLLLMDEDDNRQHFNLKQLMEADSKTKKKKKAKYAKKNEDEEIVEDNFKLDMIDPRFGVLFENPHYNIDPSAPEFKKTKAMESLINEKIERSQKKNNKKEKLLQELDSVDVKISNQKRKGEINIETVNKKAAVSDVTKQSKDTELTSLIKSVKAKTKLAKNKKKLK